MVWWYDGMMVWWYEDDDDDDDDDDEWELDEEFYVKISLGGTAQSLVIIMTMHTYPETEKNRKSIQ